jgi:hypothetical protein
VWRAGQLYDGGATDSQPVPGPAAEPRALFVIGAGVAALATFGRRIVKWGRA